MPRNEYGCVHHFIRPLWASTTWNSWMRSRFSVSATSMRSASPRVPTSEKLCTRWSAPKSSTAARNSRLSWARWAESWRRQAGSTCRNVYLTKWRSLTPPRIRRRRRTWIRVFREEPLPGLGGARALVLRSVSRTRSAPERPLACRPMRIALVSPYSWTYPGGVTRHIEALAAQFGAEGHDVRVFSPYDPPDRLSARLHRGAVPEAREAPDWLVPLGRTIGVESNGAVSNLAPTPYGLTTLRKELRAMRPDVIHIHEPPAPTVGYDALDATVAPLVGTFHCYSENAVSHGIANTFFGVRRKLQRLHVRIAVSEAAAWTGRRFYGGHYRVIPNGVDVPPPLPAHAPPGRRLARPALLRRPLPRDPDRRGRPRRRAGQGARRRPPAAPGVRRPGGRAQGPARPAARLRGAARAHARRARRRRCGRGPGRPADARHERRPRARQGLRRAQARRACRRRPARRAVARRRELRDGADRGLRGRHPGRRERHRRLPRCRARRRGRRARPPRRAHRARRGLARPRPGPGPPDADGAERRRPRAPLRLAGRRGRGAR